MATMKHPRLHLKHIHHLVALSPSLHRHIKSTTGIGHVVHSYDCIRDSTRTVTVCVVFKETTYLHISVTNLGGHGLCPILIPVEVIRALLVDNRPCKHCKRSPIGDWSNTACCFVYVRLRSLASKSTTTPLSFKGCTKLFPLRSNILFVSLKANIEHKLGWKSESCFIMPTTSSDSRHSSRHEHNQ
jgi:hypothetical protein